MIMVWRDDVSMMPPNPIQETLITDFLINGELCPELSSEILVENKSTVLGDPKTTFFVGKLNGRMMGANGFNLAYPYTTGTEQPSSSVLLTNPPGLSSTSPLESPVFLSNSMILLSPTTEKFPFNSRESPSSFPITNVPKRENVMFEDIPQAFAFKPPLDPNSFLLDSERRVVTSFDQQHYFPSIKVSVQSENPMKIGPLSGGVNLHNQQESNLQDHHKIISDNVMVNQRMPDSYMCSHHSPPPVESDGEEDQKELSSMTVDTTAEDGYNWRKYGQKQVKGSEYPRSYYKCTIRNCQVKKKVERSHEGYITEIIYKGVHNHPKPPSNRRSGVLLNPFNDQLLDGTEQPDTQGSFDGKAIWSSTQSNNGGQVRRNDGLEATSASFGTGELCDPSTTDMQPTQDTTRLADALDVSSTMSNSEEENDRATLRSFSVGCDGDDTETKRRIHLKSGKLEACAIETSTPSRVLRDPRIVLKTLSEIDILDDGYHWRKYGQKVVKGNPNPRSYYKCTDPGCTVRKHVERAPHDLKSVITTYDGKHNHDVPAARNSNHTNSVPSNTSANTAPRTHRLMRKVEPTQDGLTTFESHTLLGAYCLPGIEQWGAPTGFSFAMGQMDQPGFTNLAIAGLGPMAPIKMPVLHPVHAYLGGYQQLPEGGFIVPKGEPKEEAVPSSRLPML